MANSQVQGTINFTVSDLLAVGVPSNIIKVAGPILFQANSITYNDYFLATSVNQNILDGISNYAVIYIRNGSPGAGLLINVTQSVNTAQLFQPPGGFLAWVSSPSGAFGQAISNQITQIAIGTTAASITVPTEILLAK